MVRLSFAVFVAAVEPAETLARLFIRARLAAFCVKGDGLIVEEFFLRFGLSKCFCFIAMCYYLILLIFLSFVF